MILDALLQFDPAGTTIGGGTGTFNSTNIIDLGGPSLPASVNGLQPSRDMGIGDDPALKLLVLVTTTFTSGGAGTLAVNLQGATDNGAGAPNAFTTWWSSSAAALATLVAGARLFDMDMPRPPAGVAIPRFLRMTYTVAVAAFTAGAYESMLVLDRHDQPYQGTANSTLGGYPAGIYINN